MPRGARPGCASAQDRLAQPIKLVLTLTCFAALFRLVHLCALLRIYRD